MKPSTAMEKLLALKEAKAKKAGITQIIPNYPSTFLLRDFQPYPPVKYSQEVIRIPKKLVTLIQVPKYTPPSMLPPTPTVSTPVTPPVELTTAQKLAIIRGLTKPPASGQVQVQLPAHQIPTIVGELLPKVELPNIPVEEGGRKEKHDVTFDDLNEEQKLVVEYARKGISFCLIGGAGTGKTTTTQVMTKILAESGIIKTLNEGTKNLRMGAPSIVFISFTNVAVANIKAAVPEVYKNNCLSAHKLCEYQPTFYEDSMSGRTTMRFEPARNALNPIRGLTHMVWEESGTMNLSLADTVFSANGNPNTVYIFLGDLQQLPPAFGDGVLGFKLLELPTIQLSKIYRTDNDSPIKELAYRIQEGTPITDKELDEIASHSSPEKGTLELFRYATKASAESSVIQLGNHFAKLTKAGTFDPEKDVVLIPYNVGLGIIEIGKYIAQARSEITNSPIYHIISGIKEHYLSVGDLMYYNKRKMRITAIASNSAYIGKQPELPSLHIDRWGRNSLAQDAAYQQEKTNAEINRMQEMFETSIDKFGLTSDDEDAGETIKRAASHCITMVTVDDDDPVEFTISSSGEINNMYFAHCLTVYKAQGSEWDRVYCIFHHSHKQQISRETIYTAITRARKYLKIYYHGEKTSSKKHESTFYKGMLSQRIPGNTLAEKLEYFKHKLKVEMMKLSVRNGKTYNTDNPTKEEVNQMIHDMLASQNTAE